MHCMGGQVQSHKAEDNSSYLVSMELLDMGPAREWVEVGPGVHQICHSLLGTLWQGQQTVG